MESAEHILNRIRADIAADGETNSFVTAVCDGIAPLTAIAALAAEEHRIVASDWTSFLNLAARASNVHTRRFFTMLADGEALALPKLTPLAAAAGFDEAAIADYRLKPGCQGYSAYVSWLALNSEPTSAVLAILANFQAWGLYCGKISAGLRQKYGFSVEAVAFFDFFAAPASELYNEGLRAVRAGLDNGELDYAKAVSYSRLLMGFEAMFWHTLSEISD